MTIAEKYYRKFYKVQDGVDLSTEQWKVVRMMHECLREHNKPKLPMGTIIVNRKALATHLEKVRISLKDVDCLMMEPEYKDFAMGSGGSKLAKIANELNLSKDAIGLFELKIPLFRLNEEIK